MYKESPCHIINFHFTIDVRYELFFSLSGSCKCFFSLTINPNKNERRGILSVCYKLTAFAAKHSTSTSVFR